MKNVLVLCTGNSCRNQIAHGYLQYYYGDHAHVYSAGVEGIVTGKQTFLF